MKTCKRCNQSYATADWPRYSRNGRLMVYCSPCNAALDIHRAEVEAAKARGYASVGRTPEYKREQRRRAAEKAGRVFVTLEERRRILADRNADRLRARWAAGYLRGLSDASALYANDPRFRVEKCAASRGYYSRHRIQESARVQDYKAANVGRVMGWHSKRKQREAAYSDGTATTAAISQLKREACNCAYCGSMLIRKQTDHMIPLALGGEHSLRNIVVTCPDCNAHKARLSYVEWIERAPENCRPRIIALYEERYGQSIAA